MIKGVQKNVVSVKLSENRYFESAYFVMRSGAPPTGRGQGDMLSEAQKVLREHDLLKKKKPSLPSSRGKWRFFLWGTLTGFGITALLSALLFLLP